MTNAADFLDRQLPLNGASHRDVVAYDVRVPMRYTECIATLRDGRRIGLQRPRQFLGFTGGLSGKTMFFQGFDDSISIDLGASKPTGIATCTLTQSTRGDSLIQPDGTLLGVAITARRELQPVPRQHGARLPTFPAELDGVAQPA